MSQEQGGWEEAADKISETIGAEMQAELNKFDTERLVPIVKQLQRAMNEREQIEFKWLQAQVREIEKLPKSWIRMIYADEYDFFDAFQTDDKDPRTIQEPRQHQLPDMFDDGGVNNLLQHVGLEASRT